MALTTIDFVTGIDFTGKNPISAADLNNAVGLAEPKSDTNGDGKGLILYSNDSALNTAVVPRADLTPKLQRYLWVRIPHPTAVDQGPITYAWNENAVNSAIYYKWVITVPTSTALTTRVTNLEADSDLILATANNANDKSDAALAKSIIATTTADTASGVAEAAKATADASKVTADAASVLATTANTTATAAVTTVTAKRTAEASLVVGGKQQRLRTSEDLAKVEWYYEVDNYVSAAYIGAPQAINNDTWTKIPLNTLVNNSGALAASDGSSLTFKAGTYKCTINANTISLEQCVLLLGNDTLKTKLLTGIMKNANISGGIFLSGVFSVVADTVVSLYVYAKSDGYLALDNAVGNINSNVGLPAGYAIPAVSEQYVLAEFVKIG